MTRAVLAVRAATVALCVLVLALFVAQFPLSSVTPGFHLQLDALPMAILLLVLAAVGAVVAWRQPANPMGWMLLADAVFFGLDNDASMYSVLVYTFGHHLPLGAVAVLLQPSWAPGIVLLALMVMLFPDGHVPSPRLRWVVRGYLAFGTIWVLGALAIALTAIVQGRVSLDSGGNLRAIDSPTGAMAWWGSLQSSFFFVLMLAGAAAVVSQAASFRGSDGERRQQLKWLLGGSLICLLSGGMIVFFTRAGGVWGQLANVGSVGLYALPISIGVAVLRYRLYEIDRIISRTLGYAVLTGTLVALYVGLVLLATRVLSFSSPVAVAGSTLTVAALFSVLRRRVQQGVDRRFNRARYDAEQMVGAFASRLQGAVDLDSVRADLGSVVHRALEPAHVSVWISRREV